VSVQARKKKGMPVNWPPPSGTYPSWPPIELGADAVSFYSLWMVGNTLRKLGFTQEAPTPSENSLYFSNSVRCDENHQVIGRMLVSPDGLRRYPFAACVNAQHRDGLVLWPPYYAGLQGGRDTP